MNQVDDYMDDPSVYIAGDEDGFTSNTLRGTGHDLIAVRPAYS